ncbi:transposase [Streptomyces sp. NBC_00989]|uniref:transposase n=1 Tax=Streptomyces sp. NBC_00989 TaxID=2903705 RepID=UPI00386C64BD
MGIRRTASGPDLSRCCREASSRAVRRTGAPWRDVPERHGPWDRVNDLFRRRQRDGTWARIVTQLEAEADAKRLITWDVNTAAQVRQGLLQAAAHGRVRDQPPQAPPGRSHEV